VLTEMMRESSEIAIEAQKKLLNLAIQQMESAGEIAGKRVEAARAEARTSWDNLTKKSVRNFATAQKSLMDLVVKPVKASPTDKKRKAARVRPKRNVGPVEAHEAA